MTDYEIQMKISPVPPHIRKMETEMDKIGARRRAPRTISRRPRIWTIDKVPSPLLPQLRLLLVPKLPRHLKLLSRRIHQSLHLTCHPVLILETRKSILPCSPECLHQKVVRSRQPGVCVLMLMARKYVRCAKFGSVRLKIRPSAVYGSGAMVLRIIKSALTGLTPAASGFQTREWMISKGSTGIVTSIITTKNWLSRWNRRKSWRLRARLIENSLFYHLCV